MVIKDRIQAGVQKLPTEYQVEVLDFVESLLTKSKQNLREPDEVLWSDFSLASAMRDIEEEDSPQYTEADLKVNFS